MILLLAVLLATDELSVFIRELKANFRLESLSDEIELRSDEFEQQEKTL